MKKTKLTQLVLVFLCAIFSFAVQAKQEFSVKDGDTILIKISAKEVNRIAMSNGRLSKLWGSDHLLVEVDKDKGEAYITPSLSSPTSFSFFVRDDQGSTFTIVAQQYDVPSETILLSSSVKSMKVDPEIDRKLRETSHVNNIKFLMKSMALNKSLNGYKVEEVSQQIKLWKEIKLTLNTLYLGNRFQGEKYTLQNITNQEMRFDENEFLSLGEGVSAVALDKLVLQPNEITFLYIIRYGEQ